MRCSTRRSWRRAASHGGGIDGGSFVGCDQTQDAAFFTRRVLMAPVTKLKLYEGPLHRVPREHPPARAGEAEPRPLPRVGRELLRRWRAGRSPRPPSTGARRTCTYAPLKTTRATRRRELLDGGVRRRCERAHRRLGGVEIGERVARRRRRGATRPTPRRRTTRAPRPRRRRRRRAPQWTRATAANGKPARTSPRSCPRRAATPSPRASRRPIAVAAAERRQPRVEVGGQEDLRALAEKLPRPRHRLVAQRRRRQRAAAPPAQVRVRRVRRVAVEPRRFKLLRRRLRERRAALVVAPQRRRLPRRAPRLPRRAGALGARGRRGDLGRGVVSEPRR